MNNYTYDLNGNRIQNVKTVIGQGTTTYNYQYDLENRLTKVLSGNTEITSYAYFSDGSRVRRTASGVATYFLYDFRDFNGFNDVIAEYDATGNLVARYVHGPGIDEPLAMFRGSSWYYYHFDGLGSVTMLTRSDKTVANRYVYDDFGGFRGKTEVVTNTYGFTGREYDSAVNLIYYRARYYDPLIGRFLTRDPTGMADGPNLYAYAGTNPINRGDPSGLDAWNLWIPCALWVDLWGFHVKWIYFDWDVFASTLLQFALFYSVRGANLWALYTYVWGCVFVTKYVCFPLIISAFATGAGWIAALSCLLLACGLVYLWLGVSLYKALSCR